MAGSTGGNGKDKRKVWFETAEGKSNRVGNPKAGRRKIVAKLLAAGWERVTSRSFSAPAPEYVERSKFTNKEGVLDVEAYQHELDWQTPEGRVRVLPRV